MNRIDYMPGDAVRIKGSIDHWIDRNGNVFALDKRNFHGALIKKAQFKVHGYMYCGIRYKGDLKNTSKRVHRLVAEAFIPNPEGLPCVGHKNNVKSDNRVENLYWTTVQENTQKAFDEGLAKNDYGINDSQSHPCIMFDTKTNDILDVYGSIREAGSITGICESTIARQCKYHRPVRKPFYFRFCDRDTYFFYKSESTTESDK